MPPGPPPAVVLKVRGEAGKKATVKAKSAVALQFSEEQGLCLGRDLLCFLMKQPMGAAVGNKINRGELQSSLRRKSSENLALEFPREIKTVGFFCFFLLLLLAEFLRKHATRRQGAGRPPSAAVGTFRDGVRERCAGRRAANTGNCGATILWHERGESLPVRMARGGLAGSHRNTGLL